MGIPRFWSDKPCPQGYRHEHKGAGKSHHQKYHMWSFFCMMGSACLIAMGIMTVACILIKVFVG